MEQELVLAGELIFVEEGTASSISAQLVSIGEMIEAYCGEDVNTQLHIENGIYKIRYELSYKRAIEFKTIRRNFYIEYSDKKYCVLQLNDLTHFDRRSLVMKILKDVFDLTDPIA